MPAYSPPLTRQRARALILSKARSTTASSDLQQKRQQQPRHERHKECGRLTPTGEEAPGAEGQPARITHSRARSARGAEERSRGHPALLRPASAETLGSSASRCRKAVTRLGRARSRAHSPVGENSKATAAESRRNSPGGDGQCMSPDPSRRPAPQDHGMLMPAGAASGESPAPAASSSGSILVQPLEELHPSVLNANVSGDNVSTVNPVENYPQVPQATASGAVSGDVGKSRSLLVRPRGSSDVEGEDSGGGADGSSTLDATDKEAGAVVAKEGGERVVGGIEDNSRPHVARAHDAGVIAAAGRSGGTSDGASGLPTPPGQTESGGLGHSGPGDRGLPAAGTSSLSGAMRDSRAVGSIKKCDATNAGDVVVTADAPACAKRSETAARREGDGGGSGGGVGAGIRDRGVEAGARLHGKSVEATGSTGVSPMQKRNRRELKLSEEETAMAGAPQGPVYQVQVLETDELDPSPVPEEEMQAVLTASGGSGDWADLYSAVDSARRLCIYHRDVVLGHENLEGVVSLIEAAVGNLRSSTVRNALLAVADMFRFLGHDMRRVDFRAMLAGTLQRLAGDKRFICQTAAQAMEAATRSGPSVEVLHAILPSIDDRNSDVSAKSTVYAEQCLAVLGVGAKAGAGLPDDLRFHAMADGFARALNAKVADGRNAARRGLLRLRKAMGQDLFETTMANALGGSEAASVLTTLSASARARGAGPSSAAAAAAAAGPAVEMGQGFSRDARGAGARGSIRGAKVHGAAAARPSIRQQMMAAKRKKAAEEKEQEESIRRGARGSSGADGIEGDSAVVGGSSGSAGPGFVIVT